MNPLQRGAQGLLPDVSLGNITHECHDPFRASTGVVYEVDGELDGDLPPVFVEGGDAEQLTVVVPGDAGRHRHLPPGPVPLAEAVRDDDVKRAV